jgi:hypothetical protein
MATTRRALRRLALPLVLFCALVLPLSGCEYKTITVQIPTFFSAGVQELWFWRLDEGANQYVRTGHLKFGDLYGPPGRKVIQYTMVFPDGQEGLTLTAPVKVQGDAILVELNYARMEDAGNYRVSSRNRAGESALSESDILL